MSARTPVVSADRVYDPARPAAPIGLDTPDWFTWLETATSFSSPLFDPACGSIVGLMTVRKEARQRGGAYWSVYRRCGPSPRRVYLGRSERVTSDRLEGIARALRDERGRGRGRGPGRGPVMS